MQKWFRDILARHDRIAVVGGPKTGKTTLAHSANDRTVISTDMFRALPWSDVPKAIIRALRFDRFVVEGTQVARALRKGLKVDAVIVLNTEHDKRSSGQEAMTKAVDTVLKDYAEGLSEKDRPVFYFEHNGSVKAIE